MKKLISPGQVVVVGGMPRTRVGPDVRGFRICFDSLGRSCAASQGFLNFTDGSQYAYTPPSNGVVEQLAPSVHRGRFFNWSFRRVGSGYVRGYIPPGDYSTIYSYPPYAGSVPAACPAGGPDWPATVWSPIGSAGGDAAGTFSGASFTVTASKPGPFLPAGNWQWFGTLSYTGPAANCNFHYSGIFTPNTFANQALFQIEFVQDGNSLLFLQFGKNYALDPNAAADFPFPVADTMGGASALVINILWTANSIGGTQLAVMSASGLTTNL